MKKEEEVKIEKGRDKDSLTIMMKEIFDKVNEYNKQNPGNPINIMLLSRDNKGGASFMIGEVGPLVKEFYEVMSRHGCFREFFKAL
jgi:hypothetical protein